MNNVSNNFFDDEELNNRFDIFPDSGSRSSGEIIFNDNKAQENYTNYSKNFRYSPDTTDYDSNCGDFDSELSLKYIGSEFNVLPSLDVNTTNVNFSRFCASMPVLEDGLSSGHASDTENNNSCIMNDINYTMNVLHSPKKVQNNDYIYLNNDFICNNTIDCDNVAKDIVNETKIIDIYKTTNDLELESINISSKCNLNE